MCFIISDGLPKTLDPGQLAKSLQAVAAATVDSRHPGPRPNSADPLQRILTETIEITAPFSIPAMASSEEVPTPRGEVMEDENQDSQVIIVYYSAIL